MTRYSRERKLRIAYIPRVIRTLYLALHWILQARPEHVNVFIWTRAPQLIRLSTYALCVCVLVINCHNLYARNSYFTLAILPAKEIISLSNARSRRHAFMIIWKNGVPRATQALIDANESKRWQLWHRHTHAPPTKCVFPREDSVARL